MTSNANEQLRLQYCFGKEARKYSIRNHDGWDTEQKRYMVGNRSRSLATYSEFLTSEYQNARSYKEGFEGIEENGLYFLFDHYLAQKGKVVWADLGCGNGIALRQGKQWFQKTGRGINNLVTVGYDVLPFDEREYNFRKKNKRSETVGSESFIVYEADDLDPKYKPTIHIEDITYCKFPEPPDIVTCFQVLQWTTNPLEIFSNAASQMQKGSILTISGLNGIFYTETPKENSFVDYLFLKIAGKREVVPGFDFIYYPGSFIRYPQEPEIFLRTDEPVSDFTFGFQHAFSEHPWDNYIDSYGRSYLNSYYPTFDE